jgi:formylglycine-generating enzyme required for sulfatase activity
MKIRIAVYGILLSTLFVVLAACDKATDGPDVPRDDLANNFVLIPGGTFTMGSPETEAERYDNEIQHSVTVNDFYIGKYEVTQKEYWNTMGRWPQSAPTNHGVGDNYPMYNLTFYDAVAFCNKRSVDEGLTPAYSGPYRGLTWDRSATGYRLPTEAEWEYACRAGTTTPFNTGNDITETQANYDGSGTENKTVAVGHYAPNAFGLYDMHGNVWEWCYDWYAPYSIEDQTDPAVDGRPESEDGTDRRVMRGGAYSYTKLYGRSALRNASNAAVCRLGDLGFRVVRP